MSEVRYSINEKVNIENFEEGLMLSLEEGENIICLGRFERELFRIVLENSMNDAVSILSNKYVGNSIEEDLMEFCDKLCKLGILQIKEL